MNNQIHIKEETIRAIVSEMLKRLINENSQEETFMSFNRFKNNDIEEPKSNKNISSHLIQALNFLSHGNTLMVRSEITTALRLLNWQKDFKSVRNGWLFLLIH